MYNNNEGKMMENRRNLDVDSVFASAIVAGFAGAILGGIYNSINNNGINNIELGETADKVSSVASGCIQGGLCAFAAMWMGRIIVPFAKDMAIHIGFLWDSCTRKKY